MRSRAFAFIAALCLCSPALADDNKDCFYWRLGKDDAEKASRRAACDRIIAGKGATDTDRAVAYAERASWDEQDNRRADAIADFDHALALDPSQIELTANGIGDLAAAHFTNNATFGFHFVDVSIPPTYYDGTAGLHGYALLVALHNIIKGHTSLTYSFTATAFHNTDKRPDGNVWDVYSDVPGGTPPYEFAFGPLGSGGSEGIAYNREHSFPQSWFGGSNLPMYSDLWIIYPTDSKVNGERGNYPYGQVGTATWTSLNGTKLGNCVSAGYSGTCFEPIDGYKGDLSRSQFYVATRYFDEDASWPGGASTNRSQLLKWAADQYLAWSIADPVSWKERVRNAAIYEYQHNRNPFVDHPEFASAIWDSSNVTAVGPNPLSTTGVLAAMPMPFRTRTVLAWDLAERGSVTLRVYDVSGRLVRSLVPGVAMEAGRHSIEWDGRDDGGAPTTAGLYFGRLEAGGRSDVVRVVRLR